MFATIADKIFDTAASIFLAAVMKRPPRKIVQELQELLSDPDIPLISFEEISFKIAVYEHEPHKLVYILKHHIGAERYRNAEGQEVWGLPARNPTTAHKTGLLYGRYGIKIVLGVAVLGLLMGLLAPKATTFSSKALLTIFPPYKCHESPGEILPGLCYPEQFSMDLAYPVRISLLINCLGQNTPTNPFEKDRYKSVSCYRYLTEDEATKIGLFSGTGLFRRDYIAVLDGDLSLEELRTRWITYRVLELYP